MGITELEIQIANPKDPKKRLAVKCLIDSGAVYSVIPEKVLKNLRIKSHSSEKFILADGSEIERERGDALFFFREKQGASPVVFGKKGDGVLLGAVTLESLGFIIDPIRRQIRSLPMVLASFRKKA